VKLNIYNPCFAFWIGLLYMAWLCYCCKALKTLFKVKDAKNICFF